MNEGKDMLSGDIFYNLSYYERFVKDMFLGEKPLLERNPSDLFALTIGLVEEAGEVAGRVKKYLRDGNSDPEKMLSELGDLQYYLTSVACAWNFNLNTVFDYNVEKLTERKRNGTHGGPGVNR